MVHGSALHLGIARPSHHQEMLRMRCPITPVLGQPLDHRPVQEGFFLLLQPQARQGVLLSPHRFWVVRIQGELSAHLCSKMPQHFS